MLTAFAIGEIVAFDRAHRRQTAAGKPFRTTARYNYLLQTGGTPGARDFRERPGLLFLHVAVKLDQSYTPRVKIVATMDPQTARLAAGDLGYCGAAGWLVDWHCDTAPGSWRPVPLRVGCSFGYYDIVNLGDAIGTRYEFCGYLPGCGKSFLDYCLLFGRYPQIEHLAKAGLRFAIEPALLADLARDRSLLAELKARAAELAKVHNTTILRYALVHRQSVAKVKRYFDFVSRLSDSIRFSINRQIDPVRRRLDYRRLYRLFPKWRIEPREYVRYLDYAAECGLDLQNDGTLYPPVAGARAAFMDRLERLERSALLRRRERQALERKKAQEAQARRAAKLARAAAERAQELSRLQAAVAPLAAKAGYRAVLPIAQKDLRLEGKKMHNCIGSGTYAEDVAYGRSILILLKTRAGRSYADIELSRLGAAVSVRQCYLKRNVRAPAPVCALAESFAAAIHSVLHPPKAKPARRQSRPAAA